LGSHKTGNREIRRSDMPHRGPGKKKKPPKKKTPKKTKKK